MTNLKQGDVVVRVSDGTQWEFLGYDEGYITRKAEDSTFRGGEGIDKSYIHVRKLGIIGSHDEWGGPI